MRNTSKLHLLVAATVAALTLLATTAPPAAAGTPATAQVVPSGRLAGLRFHIVAKGETLKKISALYGVPAAQIRSANSMRRDVVYEGARLLLDEPNPGRMSPTAGAAATTYTVKSGDNLAKIASRNGTTVAALVAANQLPSANQIRIGQQLTIGGAAATPMVCPLPGAKVTFDWGFPRADGARFHEGNDMFAPAGTPILAPVAGTVTYGTATTPGKFATLKGANGWQYYAAHLSKNAKGGKVKAGDVIGYVGNTGDALGGAPHLHLEVRPLDGRPINPSSILVDACL